MGSGVAETQTAADMGCQCRAWQLNLLCHSHDSGTGIFTFKKWNDISGFFFLFLVFLFGVLIQEIDLFLPRESLLNCNTLNIIKNSDQR